MQAVTTPNIYLVSRLRSSWRRDSKVSMIIFLHKVALYSYHFRLFEIFQKISQQFTLVCKTIKNIIEKSCIYRIFNYTACFTELKQTQTQLSRLD